MTRIRLFSCCMFAVGAGLALFLACAGPASGALSETEITDLFSQGKDMFRQANEAGATDPDRARDLYTKAVLRFERIVREGGIRNGKLFYNIGNGYFRMNDIGRAILNYRRAERYIGDDPNLRQNLDNARSRRLDKIEERQRERVLKTIFFWHYDLSGRARTAVFAGAFVLLWCLASLRIFVKSSVLNWAVGLCCAVAVMFLASLLAEWAAESGAKEGVMVSAETVARKGDGEAFEPSFKEPLHAGTEFAAVEKRGDWLRVRIADSRLCWVPAKDVEMIR